MRRAAPRLTFGSDFTFPASKPRTTIPDQNSVNTAKMAARKPVYVFPLLSVVPRTQLAAPRGQQPAQSSTRRADISRSFNQQALYDTTPLPDSIPKVKEIGASSAPLLSASFFIGARCRDYNDDYMQCKTDNPGRGELECLKEGRRVTRCARSVWVTPSPPVAFVVARTVLPRGADRRPGSRISTRAAWSSSAPTGSVWTTTTTSCGNAGRPSGASTSVCSRTWCVRTPSPRPATDYLTHPRRSWRR